MVTENQRLPRIIRDDSPCNGCTERFYACSDHCPKDKRGEFGYLAWKSRIKEIQSKQKAYKDMNYRNKWTRRCP